MTSAATERLHPAAKGLDDRESGAILGALLSAQADALQAVSGALPEIAAGAEIMAASIRSGGRLVYVGAGSSALMAMSDGLEIPGTFGVDADRIVILMAGGLPSDSRMPGVTEDDADDGARAGAALAEGDVVIAVTASGRTPYPLAAAKAALARGARIIAVANNHGAPIFNGADVAICLPTPPEVIAGSTRMGAGTAQKVALNLMSTLMGIRLGQVHDGMMVGLVADNTKLRMRARVMVEAIAGVDAAAAASALDAAEGAVKPAVLIACGATSDQAQALLRASDGNLRAALARTEGSDRKHKTNPGS